LDDAGLINARDYYGKVLKGSGDLRTDACCTTDAPPLAVRRALANVHDDVRARYYGCGLVAPPAIEGARLLDLGSGSGQDCYVLAQLVGPTGQVVGVDGTPEQLDVAKAHLDWHRDRFGYDRSNVRFIEGDLARLGELDLEPGSFDVIVSNCVINLVEDKAGVFRAVHELLKPGGELYFSDVYADRRVPDALRRNPVLHGECLGGALYWGDFLRQAKAAGFGDPRLVADRPLTLGDPGVALAVAPIRFFSATWRLFKLDGLETACEDYGQAVRYRGGVAGFETAFVLDKHHTFEVGRIAPVCGNTWRMLRESRFGWHFEYFGDFSRHLGIFKGCGSDLPFSSATDSVAACC
jgi:SAM-dependent methyltransferase